MEARIQHMSHKLSPSSLNFGKRETTPGKLWAFLGSFSPLNICMLCVTDGFSKGRRVLCTCDQVMEHLHQNAESNPYLGFQFKCILCLREQFHYCGSLAADMLDARSFPAKKKVHWISKLFCSKAHTQLALLAFKKMSQFSKMHQSKGWKMKGVNIHWSPKVTNYAW